MADESTPVADPAPDAVPDATPAANDATPSGKAGEEATPKTFTQADVDRMVADARKQARAKVEKEAEQAKAAAEAKLKAEQGDYKALWEEEKAKAEAAAQEAKELRLSALKRDAAAKHNLPAALADRLKGETLEELEDDAKAIAETLPKPGAPNINAGSGTGKPTATQTEEELARLSGVLGIPVQYLKQKQGG